MLLGILLLVHSRNPFDSDEGVILEGAWNMLNGKTLYTNFFEFIPPGSFYFVFLLWKIFSPTYFAAKLFSVLLFWLTGIGIYKISRIFRSSILNYIAPAIFVCSSFFWPIINHNANNLFFLVYATYFFLVGLSKNQNKFYLCSGLLSGISILFLQQKGIILCATLFSYLIFLAIFEKSKEKIKQALIYFGSAFLATLIIFIKWSPVLLYNNLIKFALSNYIETNKMPFGILIFFVILTVLAMLLLKNQKSKRIYFLFYLQFTLLATTFARPDNYHILLVIFPLYSLLPLIILEILKINSYAKYLYLAIISLVLFLIVIPSLLFISMNPPTFKRSPLYQTVDFIKENCPRNNDLYVGPFIPGLYFEAKKVNFTPYYILMTGFQGQEYFETTRKLLEINQPKCIVMNYEIVKKFNYSQDNPVDNYIKSNYTLKKQVFADMIFIKN